MNRHVPPNSPSVASPPDFWIEYERPYLYPKQFAAIYDTHRFSIIEASSKAGKTSGCISWLVEMAIGGQSGQNYWWVAPVSDQARIAFLRMRRALPNDVYTVSRTLKTITLLNGAVIWFKSGDKPDCYDDKTEILTQRGWRLFRDLDGEDIVMTRSAEGFAEWQKPTKIISCRYSGEMVSIANKRIDLLVTPNHRMLIERRKGRDRRQEEWTTAELLRTRDTIPALADWAGTDHESITEDRCALLGFYLAEGSAIGNCSADAHAMAKKYGYRINFAQTEGIKGGDKGDVRAEFCGVLDRLGYRYKPKRGGLMMWDRELWSELIGLGNKYTKYIPARVKDLPKEKLKVLLRWLVLGDGSSRRGNQWTYFTASRRLADDVQEIALKCGWNATIREREPKPFKRPSKPDGGNAVVGYTVRIQKAGKSHHLTGAGGKSYVDRTGYAGMVYCVSVPNKTVLVRRSGKPIWCGNSLYGEDVYAAVIDEASRFKEEAYIAVRTTLTYTKGPIRIIGNVRGRKNFFFKMARRAERAQMLGIPSDAGYHKIVAADAVAAGVLDQAEIDEAREQMPEQWFRELYLAEASDDGGNPFGMQHIEACIRPEIGFKTGVVSSKAPRAWGWDFAKKRDYFVGIGLDEDGAICRFVRHHHMPWGEVKNTVVKEMANCPGLGDSTGVGDPIVEDIQRMLGQQPGGEGSFQGYVFTSASKQRLMEGLAAAIQGRTVWFPDGVVRQELEQFEFEISRTGVRYSAPAGYFDDCVCALALARMCFALIPAPVRVLPTTLRQIATMPKRRKH